MMAPKMVAVGCYYVWTIVNGGESNGGSLFSGQTFESHKYWFRSGHRHTAMWLLCWLGDDKN